MNRIGSLIVAGLAALVSFLPLSAECQTVAAIDKIQLVFSKGNTDGLESMMSDDVEIGWEGKKTKYARSKSVSWIKEFIKNHPPIAFEYVHKGTSKDGMQYAIGKYTSGSDFWRIYIVLKETKGKYLLETVDVSKE